MANEAIMVYNLGPAIPMTVSDGTGIEKGSMVSLADLNTAALAADSGVELGGITASEKIASDGKTKLGVYPNGIFKMYASGAIVVGRAISSAADANYPNHVKEAGVTESGAAILGYARETAATTETFLAHVNVGCGGNQIS